MSSFVSRAGAKLEHALAALKIEVAAKVCADLGCSTGGFTDCLLRHHAAKVFAVDTGYGVLDWKLRNDPRVVVMERTNAMHVELPERVEIVTIDVGWTRQKHILPSVRRSLAARGTVVTLIKPHYEAERSRLRKGILPDEFAGEILESIKKECEEEGWIWGGSVQSPIRGSGGNLEFLARLAMRA